MSEENKEPVLHGMEELAKLIEAAHKAERETDNVEMVPSSFVGDIDKILDELEFEKIDPLDTTKYLSNEVYYEEIAPSIKWENSEVATCSKLFIRTIIEMAYRRGKKDGINTVSTLALEYHSKEEQKTLAEDLVEKQKNLADFIKESSPGPHINKKVPTPEHPIGMYRCPKCGTTFNTSVILCSDPPQVRCPSCGNTFHIGRFGE